MQRANKFFTFEINTLFKSCSRLSKIFAFEIHLMLTLVFYQVDLSLEFKSCRALHEVNFYRKSSMKWPIVIILLILSLSLLETHWLSIQLGAWRIHTAIFSSPKGNECFKIRYDSSIPIFD